MNFSVITRPDLEHLGKSLAQGGAELQKRVQEVLNAGAFMIEEELVRLISPETPKHGKSYKRGGKIHVSSAPGEPPATDTGQLLAHVRSSVSFDEAEVGVTLGAPYAKFLEEGTHGTTRSTRGGWRMAPRPFLQPAVDAHIDEIMDMAAEALKGTLRMAMKGESA